MNKVFLVFFTLIIMLTNISANTSSDCIIIKEDNSIICKYIHSRKTDDRNIRIEWINPNKEISRVKELILPAGHGSVYDFRYVEGRIKGIWTFRVIDNDITTSTTFEIK